MTDHLRDAAIRALCDFAEQPHPGRAGEAIDALERHLRASQPATESAPEDAGSLVPHAKIPVALEGVNDMDWEPDEPVEGVSAEAARWRTVVDAINARMPEGYTVQVGDRLSATLPNVERLVEHFESFRREAAAKDARIADLDERLTFAHQDFTRQLDAKDASIAELEKLLAHETTHRQACAASARDASLLTTDLETTIEAWRPVVEAAKRWNSAQYEGDAEAEDAALGAAVEALGDDS